MGRLKAEIDQDEFLLLYKKGFTDQAIAEHFCVHRSTITRRRQQMSLPPVRKRGERGPGAVQKNLPYYVETFALKISRIHQRRSKGRLAVKPRSGE